tara:strand:- start:8 stop:112 length:105 start_codon:yes stop_codon:yes gene_type:complete
MVTKLAKNNVKRIKYSVIGPVKIDLMIFGTVENP